MILIPIGKPRLNTKIYKLRNNKLLYPEGIVTLNESAYKILSLCDGERTVFEIKESIFQEYKLNEHINNDIDEMLTLFYKNNYIN